MTQSLSDIVETLLSRLKSIATTETVIGNAVKVDNLTVIPVVKISMGFGVGVGENLPREGEKGKGTGYGGGTGGGLSISPVAFITYDGKDVKLLTITKSHWESVVESIPEALHKLGILRSSPSSQKDESGESTT